MVADRHARLDEARALKAAMSLEGNADKAYDPNKYLMLLDYLEGRERGPRSLLAILIPPSMSV